MKIMLRRLVHEHFLDSLERQWSYHQIETISHELSRKAVTLNAQLHRDLDAHPWYPPSSEEALNIHFDKNFLHNVHAFHKSVERPEGTFVDAESVDDLDANVDILSCSPRDICPKCQHRRQLYCGACFINHVFIRVTFNNKGFFFFQT